MFDAVSKPHDLCVFACCAGLVMLTTLPSVGMSECVNTGSARQLVNGSCNLVCLSCLLGSILLLVETIMVLV